MSLTISLEAGTLLSKFSRILSIFVLKKEEKLLARLKGLVKLGKRLSFVRYSRLLTILNRALSQIMG